LSSAFVDSGDADGDKRSPLLIDNLVMHRLVAPICGLNPGAVLCILCRQLPGLSVWVGPSGLGGAAHG